jgi:hypothetical protein
MELIAFFLFFSFVILFTILGYWKQDFVALIIAGFMFALLGVFVLSQGIAFPDGYELSSTTTERFTYGCRECENATNGNVLLNSTSLRTESSTPKTLVQKTGFVYAMGSIMILVALYLVWLGVDIAGMAKNKG